MSLNYTPSSERTHIGIFGRRNSGKSSLINAITGQDIAIVSDIEGTTTDPVKKAIEIPEIGPAVIIDTPGLDDDSALGQKRIEKAKQILNEIDLAILVVDCSKGFDSFEQELIKLFEDKSVNYIQVCNKMDLAKNISLKLLEGCNLWSNAITGEGISSLIGAIQKALPQQEKEKKLVADLLTEGDIVLLVTPVDKHAPKGRLILPQQQTIRDILDTKAIAVTAQPQQITKVLAELKNPPRLVITDSQAFAETASYLPPEVPLTSFSILLNRYKADLPLSVKGARALKNLKDGDEVLIAEACTYIVQEQCENIGIVKIPKAIEKISGKKINISFAQGKDFPELIEKKYALIVHCGACMLKDSETRRRFKLAEQTGIPITNYGILLAYASGILDRALEPFAAELTE